MSGVAVRHGGSNAVHQQTFGSGASKVLQSHTYAGASALALMAAEQTLNMAPQWFDQIARSGDICRAVLHDRGLRSMRVRGQGLLWGAEWSLPAAQIPRANELLAECCRAGGVWPYFVPKGFILTPLLDVEEKQLKEGLRRLTRAVERTVQSMREDGLANLLLT